MIALHADSQQRTEGFCNVLKYCLCVVHASLWQLMCYSFDDWHRGLPNGHALSHGCCLLCCMSKAADKLTNAFIVSSLAELRVHIGNEFGCKSNDLLVVASQAEHESFAQGVPQACACQYE